MDDLLRGLNSAQRAAVTSPTSVLQVLAPPGSGKTKTLTARVAYLINHQQLKPWNIVVCTFTVKAAREMKDRIRGFVGEGLEKRLVLGTFHSVALRYLKQYGQHIGIKKDFGIADTSDSKAIINRTIRERKFGITPGAALTRISAQKAKSIDSEQFAQSAKKIDQQEFAQVYAIYEATLKASNLLDYDDLLLRCAFLLKTHPQCVSNVQAVLIDEFQDTNNIQYDLMGLFAQQLNAITIVGDPDQSIYGFRNAEIANLHRMRKQWPDTLTINLQENYRSSGAILHAAQKIIEQDESRPAKKLQATHSLGERPILRKLPTAAAEAEWLVSEVTRMRALTGDLLQYGDFAVLLRSATLSRQIESALSRSGMPYRMVGGTRFFDRAEIKLLLDYLRVINAPDNSEAMARIINVPSRQIGEVTIKGLQAEAVERGYSLWQLVLNVAQGNRICTKLSMQAQKGLSAFANLILTAQRKVTGSISGSGGGSEEFPLVDLISLVLQKLSFKEFIKRKYGDECDTRWANVEELMAQAIELTTEQTKALIEEDGLPIVEGLEQRTLNSTKDAISAFLFNITISGEAQRKAEETGKAAQEVTISTIHAAKGLEWPVVFIPACYDGSIPHSRAEDNDEERRLLYVGMTRAQALLYLSCPTKNSRGEDTTTSTFLTQQCVDHYFEAHGPSIQLANATALAVTLKRECPMQERIDKAKISLERDEDNYWPLTGEDPLEELAKWDDGKKTNSLQPSFQTGKRRRLDNSATILRPAGWVTNSTVAMQQQETFSTSNATISTGFISLSSRYEEIKQLQEDAQLRKIDKRAEAKTFTAGKIGKTRIPRQGSIARFLSKPGEDEDKPKQSLPGVIPSRSQRPGDAGRLQDKPGTLAQTDSDVPITEQPTLPFHKAFMKRASTKPWKPPSSQDLQSVGDKYVFLSSSPPRPDTDEKQNSDSVTTGDIGNEESKLIPAGFRLASTVHTTTISAIMPRKKTLGVKRSLNGWSTRMGKG